MLFMAVRRSKKLPHGGSIRDGDLADLGKRLRAALDFGRNVRRMRRSDAANHLWEAWYCDLPELQGLLGALTARPEAHVLRLSMIFALLDCSDVIQESHLRAAIAVWDYSAASARHIFGETLGDKVADRILEGLRDAYPEVRTRNEIRAFFGGHQISARISAALDYLKSYGLATEVRVETNGRFAEAWKAVPPCAKSAESAKRPPAATLNAHIALNAHDEPREADKVSDALQTRLDL
jgi:hypothetical protein